MRLLEGERVADERLEQDRHAGGVVNGPGCRHDGAVDLVRLGFAADMKLLLGIKN